MIIYKLTDKQNRSWNNTQWGKNTTHIAPGKGILCSSGWLHGCHDKYMAILLNPIYNNFEKFNLWECKAEGKIQETPVKIGCSKLTTLRQLKIPKISLDNRKDICYNYISSISASEPTMLSMLKAGYYGAIISTCLWRNGTIWNKVLTDVFGKLS